MNFISIKKPEHPLPRDLCFATHMKIAVLLIKTNENLKKNQTTYSKTPIWEAKTQQKQKTYSKTHTWEAQTHKNQKTLGETKKTIKNRKTKKTKKNTLWDTSPARPGQ